MKKAGLFIIAAITLLASCKQPVNYTMNGEVVLINHCNMNPDDLPQRVRVRYTFIGEEGKDTVSQLIDLKQKDKISMQGKFDFKHSSDKKISSYSAEVVRPNGKPICGMLPCAGAQKCDGKTQGSNAPLGNNTAIKETLTIDCGCTTW
jgi:hypothetical protein